MFETRGNRKVLTLLVETVAREASRVILVLYIGAVLAIANVERNVAVITSELAMKQIIEGNFSVLKGGKGNGKTIEHVIRSEHLSLLFKGSRQAHVLVESGLHEKHRKTISKQICSLRSTKTMIRTCPLIRNLMVVTNSPSPNVSLLHRYPLLLCRSGVRRTKYSLMKASPSLLQFAI